MNRSDSFLPSLRELFVLSSNPGVKTPGYFHSVASRQRGLRGNFGVLEVFAVRNDATCRVVLRRRQATALQIHR